MQTIASQTADGVVGLAEQVAERQPRWTYIESPQRPTGVWRKPFRTAEIPSEDAQAVCACPHPVSQLIALFQANDFITQDSFEVAACASCGFVVTTPQPSLSEMGGYYPAEYYGTPEERRFPKPVEWLQELLYARRAKMVEAAVGGIQGRVLDVGCGRGLLLKAFRNRGWEVQGTELSDQAARYARNVANIPVETGTLEEIGFPDEQFDAITLWHVLEHVPDPRVLLAEVNRILKPGGVLMVGVPDFGGYEARLFRDKWFHLDVPRHVTHLTKPMLKQALTNTGFEDRRWSGFALEFDHFSFVQSALNKLGLQHNLLYNVLRGNSAKVLASESVPKWQVPASILLGGILGVLSLPVTFVAGILGHAGTMMVLAEKREE